MSVEGERLAGAGLRVTSLQARVSNALAIGLMSILGLGALSWYYAVVLGRQAHAKDSAVAASTQRAQGDLPLPSLGKIAPPADPVDAQLAAPGPARTLEEVPLVAPAVNSTPTLSPGAPPTKTPQELELERQLAGGVYAPNQPSATQIDSSSGARTAAFNTAGEPAAAGELSALLRPSVTAAVRAQNLPAQRLLLPKGAFIDCTLETAIDSTLPGMTTCVMATDAFGVDGKVVLLERGTKLVGETRGQVQQGAARIFVLWTQARTPTGVVVPLDSPGTDALGRSGLPGEVNTHFWQRFGAAMLVSVIDGAVQAAAQSSRGGAGEVVVNPSASQDVLTEILKNTISIPPTVTKRNGDRIQVLVARDVDFRSVYELHAVSAAH